MKKSIFLTLSALTLALGTLSTPVFADGATVVNQFNCGIIPADSGLTLFLTTKKTHSVITPSGNSVLKCEFDIPQGYAPTHALHHRGFACNTYLGLTHDSFSTTSPGGKVELTCEVKH